MEGLEKLLADRVLGQAAKLAFVFLWRDAGFDVAEEIVVDAAWLGMRLGRDRRSAQGWLQALEDADLIAIRQRDRRRGLYWITVFEPLPGVRAALPDPQGWLDFHQDEATDAGEPTPRRKGQIKGPGEIEPQGLRIGNREGQIRGPGEIEPQGLRIETWEGQIKRPGEPMPRVNSETAGGEPTPRPTGLRSREDGREMAAGRRCAGVSTQKSPRPYGTKECDSILPNCHPTQNTKTVSGNLALTQGAGVLAQKSPRESAGEGGATAGRELAEVGAAVAVLTRAAEAVARPEEQRRRLMGKIQAVVEEPITEWVLVAAANLVAIHGVPVGEMDNILGDVAAMRGTGSLRTPAAFFHKKARDLAVRFDVKWPRKAPAPAARRVEG